MQTHLATTTCIAALFAAIATTACSPRDQAEAKKAATDSAATAEQETRDAGAEAGKEIEKVKVAVAETGAKLSAKVDDAMITASVKTELAKDSALSAVKINVDTESGRVSLKGTAPSKESREQATALARNVTGVVSVDNQLTVSK
jgi:hyperosmotically inducible periplasmic protein